MIDEILKKFNLKYDNLNEAEKETLRGWLENIKTQKITVEKIKEYIRAMLSGVERELAQDNLSKTKDIFDKARMRNYLLLLDFLESPEKAKKALEKSLRNIK